MNTCVRKFFTDGKIKKPTYDFLRASSCPLPRFYGRVKVHKENAPLRPVISAVGTATYNPSKYVARILKPLVGRNGFAIQNSIQFINDVKDLVIDSESVMVSFDVKALYTSIPVDRAVQVVRTRLLEDESLSDRTSLGVDEIIGLLEICLRLTYFTFRGEFFHLQDGVAMGSPVSSVVANLFMEHFEERAIKEAGRLRPQMWDRYVDDVFAIVKRDRAEDFLRYLNNQDPCIKFTIEMEQERALPFLDVLIQRTIAGRIKTGVYRKPTHSGRVLAFDSHHPMSAKAAVVRALLDRVETHYDKDDIAGKKEEEEKVMGELEKNGYGARFIRRYARKKPCKKEQEQCGDLRRIGAPYVKGVSEAIKRVLRPMGIDLCHRASPWQWTLCNKLKDRVPMKKKKGVVYEIPCGECQLSYVGETLRTLEDRVREHRRHVQKGNVLQSAVAEHARIQEHTIRFDDARVIDQATDCIPRRVKEALHIRKREGATMNKDAGLTLSRQWEACVEKSVNG